MGAVRLRRRGGGGGVRALLLSVCGRLYGGFVCDALALVVLVRVSSILQVGEVADSCRSV